MQTVNRISLEKKRKLLLFHSSVLWGWLPMPLLWKTCQITNRHHAARENSHGREAIRVRSLWQTVHIKAPCPNSYGDPHDDVV